MALAVKLDVWQKDLLDMSRSNNLLYYKSEGRGAGIHFTVDVADLDPLYTRLLAGHQIKVANLPTDADAEEFERRLARLRARTREDLNDRGIHTLFLAFGLLEWREAEQSAETILSPLLLVPVTLERAGLLGQYSLKRLPGEDPEVNPTLREKLLHDFKAQLPVFEEIEERFERELAQRAQSVQSDHRVRGPTPRLTLDRVMREIESALPPRIPGHAVRRELHLGRFFFQKLVMYRDLQRNRDNVLAHPLLRVIGGEGGRQADPSGLVAAHELDRRVPPHEVYEILDADSSQQEAIVAAKRGASFVLQGPPGTGKSQTIANMIAEALGQGKRVLFVSEKMAALEVVRKRLDAAGLGEFCLDLHNPRADKKAFMLELKESLQAAQQLSPDNPVTWQREGDALQRAREELNQFVRELHLPRLALGESAYFAYGKLAALHAVPDAAFALPDVPAIDHLRLDRMRRALADLDQHVEVLSRYDTYPWHETITPAYSLQLASDIRAHFGRLARELERCESALAKIGPLLDDEQPPMTGAWAADTLRIGDMAITTPLPPRHWLDHDALPAVKAHVAEAAARSAAYHARRDQLLARYRASFLERDHAVLLRALTDETTPALASLRAHGETPQDVARRRRDELGAHATRAIETLDALLPAARTVAELCGSAAPAALADVADLDEIASHLLATPQPPEAWLEPATFAQTRAAVAQAGQLYAYCAQVRGILGSLYAPAFFELPLRDLGRRFREQYVSPLRFLQPGYYRDLGTLRSLLLRPGPYPVERMQTDVDQAVKLLDAEAGLRAQQAEHAALIGSAFRAEQTDWAAVNAALDWTSALHRLVAGRPPSEEIRRLASGSARHLRALRQRHERFQELWEAWQVEADYLEETCEIERLLGDDALLEEVAPDAAQAALARLRDALAAFWAALDEIAAHRLPEPERAPSSGEAGALEQVRRDLEQACELREADDWMRARGDQLTAEVGTGFAGLDTDWPRQLAMLNWSERFLALFPDRDLPEPLARLVAAPSPGADGNPDADAEEGRATLRAALPIAHEASRAIDEALRFADTVLPRAALAPAGVPFPAAPLAGIRERVRYLLDHLPELERWLACKQQLDACRTLGLGGALDALLRERPFARDAVARFEKRFFTLWLDCVWREAPTLAAFRGESHERTIGRFRELDRGHIDLARRRLIGRLGERRHAYVRNANSAALLELKRQAQLKRHRSIRHIVQRTGGALLEIKPCWMMSPLSISQFLEEGAPTFDLVIFDEASQVCAEDAICAILRGKQLIVVGDSKQLPPTRFFSKTLADDDDDPEDEGDEEERVESILNECKVRLPERSLLWHYRSQHESLIAFSNAHFYGGGLVTFPSTEAVHAGGVHWEYVADGVYQRSRTRTNPREAERVVDLIFDHVKRHPDRSLGVVALSGSQQRAIREALERRMQQAPELRAWEQELDEDNPAGFFVKNLESVQGDERDVIILSVGYGPDAPRPQGRVYANFGPVNKSGGERRLNVAVTRARTQLILVSSMTADDLPAEVANPGVRTLRSYLAYAQHGPAALREPEAGANGAAAPVFDSPFEETVYEALTARGLTLDTQVGCSGYRIDLAVRDAAGSGRYVLGIECDGARYHSSATARDRDRLRQKHLENMGWAIHRIWSTDWLRDPDGEIAKVLDRLTRATPPPLTPAPTRPPVRSAPRSAPSPAAAASTYRPLPDSPLPDSPLTDDASLDGALAQAANDLLAPTVPLAGRHPAPPEAPALRDPERTIPPLPARPAPVTTILPESRDPDPTRVRPRPQAHPPRVPAETLQRPRDPLLARLRAMGLEVVDQRLDGGRLWVIGGYELESRLSELQAAGYRFAYEAAGGNATGGQPGWFFA